MKNFVKSLFLSNRFYAVVSFIIAGFIMSYFFNFLYVVFVIISILFVVILVFDMVLLFNKKSPISANRISPDKLSNGDDNKIEINIRNNYSFNTNIELIDEVPPRFQIRDFNIKCKLKTTQEKSFSYVLRPYQRGEYFFGQIRVLVKSPLALFVRRISFEKSKMVKVYPSFLQISKYEMIALHNKYLSIGLRKIRKIGQQLEFDSIRDYVIGDDFRSINWKATARKSELMVNQYQDEISQHIYNVIDKGRGMKMPFNNLTLLDHAINTSLILSNIALKKNDASGLICFSDKVDSYLPPRKKASYLNPILETLYNQKTEFCEPSYEELYMLVRTKLTQRSLIFLYTNFEDEGILKRQLPYLRLIAQKHLLVCVFFENTEIVELANSKVNNVKDIYTKAFAKKMYEDKLAIVSKLKNNGVYSVLTTTEELTMNTINKYLEFKSRGLI